MDDVFAHKFTRLHLVFLRFVAKGFILPSVYNTDIVFEPELSYLGYVFASKRWFSFCFPHAIVQLA